MNAISIHILAAESKDLPDCAQKPRRSFDSAILNFAPLIEYGCAQDDTLGYLP
jgi:hypothetical protein